MQAENGDRPTSSEVLDALERVIGGSMTRAEGVAWAERRRDAQRPRDQFGAIPRDPLARFAFWALVSAEVCESDLRAWAAALRGERAPRAASGSWQQKHPHENRMAPFLAGYDSHYTS